MSRTNYKNNRPTGHHRKITLKLYGHKPTVQSRAHTHTHTHAHTHTHIYPTSLFFGLYKFIQLHTLRNYGKERRMETPHIWGVF